MADQGPAIGQMTRDDMLVLVGGLRRLRRSHYECGDCWYSCPKSAAGCCNDAAGDECDCGADTANALVDSLLALIPIAEAQPTCSRCRQPSPSGDHPPGPCPVRLAEGYRPWA